MRKQHRYRSNEETKDTLATHSSTEAAFPYAHITLNKHEDLIPNSFCMHTNTIPYTAQHSQHVTSVHSCRRGRTQLYSQSFNRPTMIECPCSEPNIASSRFRDCRRLQCDGLCCVQTILKIATRTPITASFAHKPRASMDGYIYVQNAPLIDDGGFQL